MITVYTYLDAFDPTRRREERVQFVDGARVSDYTPSDLRDGARVAWLNGRLAINDDPQVQDGDFVHFAAAPTGPVAAFIPYLIGAFVVSVVAGAIAKALMPKQDPVEDNLGGSTYSYYGFRNAYRPEGDAIPVVYGTMRVAAPCINQSVTGAAKWGDAVDQSVQVSISERLNSMYAVSHGPILGFGSYKGDVFDHDAFIDLVSLTGNLADNIGFQINGIDGKHIPTGFEWRTGGGMQDPITGLAGAAGLPVTDAGTSYDLAFEIPVGTDGISQSEKPFGVYAYGSSDTIIETDPNQYISQLLASKADICDVQALWARGLFSDASDGSLNNKTATVRIQYWRTDSSGTSTSKVVLLPAFSITNNTASPFSVDIPFTLYDPETYTAPVRQGYAKTISDTSRTLVNSDTTGMQRMRPGSGGFDPDLKFTFAAWVSLNSLSNARCFWLMSWCNDVSEVDEQDSTATGFGHLNSPGFWGNGDTFFGIRLQMDTSGVIPGGSAGDVYVCVTAYERRNIGSGSDYAGSWWRSATPIGNVSTSATGWPNNSTVPGKHITIAYDGTNWKEGGGGSGEFHLFVDGIDAGAMPLGEDGQFFSSGNTTWNYNGSGPGFLWRGLGTSNPGYDHVPPQFRNSPSGDVKVRIGGMLDQTSGNLYRESRGSICQLLMYNGIIGGGGVGNWGPVQAWAYQAAKATNAYGQRVFDIASMVDDPQHSPNLRMCFPLDTRIATSKYENLAYPGSSTQATGALHITDTTNVPQSNGPVYTDESGTPTTDYYYIEVFKDAPTIDGTDERDVTTVDSITTWASGTYNYPYVAYLASTLSASDQVNSNTPNITVICHGKKVKVWDGGDEDFPVFSEEWSDNPAWVALDMLTNQDYGMGSIFSPTGRYDHVDLRQFYEWSRFCDEGVPDAFGTLDFFSMKLGSTAVGDGETVYHVTLRFGITDTSDAVVQTIPESWDPDDFQSITAIEAQGISANWVTANDYEGGTNDASNRLLVRSMQYVSDTTGSGYHGYNSYMEVEVVWNRADSSGSPIFPDGAVSSEFHADEYGLTKLGSAGQYEKRCTFNGVFDQKERPAWDALIDIMQTGRAMPAKAGRRVMPVWDRPRDPVGLFTMANIVEGSLKIDYLSPELNPNSIETEILDSEHGFERRTVLVDHDSIQNPTGFGQVRKERSSRVGITRRSQAIRDAYYRLNRYALQLRQVSFKVGPDAIHIMPGDRVLVSHDVPQYGYSGRLAADADVVNIHPGAAGLVASWNQNGGDCANTTAALILSDSTTPPITGYSNTALGRAQPTASDGTAWYPAGQIGASGYNAQPTWTAQHVAVADGLYPFAGNDNPIISPLDTIDFAAQKKEFSVYVKEPTYGASEGFRINIYQYLDPDGDYVKLTQAVEFKWDGSGDLVFGAYSQSVGTGGTATTTSSPFGMSYNIAEIGSGWWRATVFYDNGNAQGQGAAGVGRYIQARMYYGFDEDQGTFHASPTGRGSNLLYYGDPTNLDGNLPNSTTKAWTQVNEGHASGANAIAHVTSVGPPFYPSETGGDAGKHGYVVKFTNDQADYLPRMQQAITLPTNWPGGSGAGNMADEVVCATFFCRVDASNAASNRTVYLRLATQSTTGTHGEYSGNQATWTITPSGAGTISYSEVESGAVQTEKLSQIAKVRQTSTTTDANWYQVDVAFSSDTDFSTLYVEVAVGGTTGGNAVVDIWGLRVHGAAGTGASTNYINRVAHQGTLMWGPLYNPNSDGSSVTAWNEGCNLQLDRDVVLDAGNSYEVYLRSSFTQDPMLSSDVTAKVTVAQNEVPASGSSTKNARSNLNVSTPRGMVPITGDVYSFGKLDASTEDIVVTDITLDPATMQREITGMEYVEAIYQDTEFGTMGDLTVSNLMPPSAGGDSALYGFGSDGPGGSALTVRAQASPYRDANAEAKAAIDITLSHGRGQMPWKQTRLWIAELTSDFTAGVPRHVTTLPCSVTSYRYDDAALDPSKTYRVYAQRVGFRGTGTPIEASPSADVQPVVTPRLPTAPTLSMSTDGFTQMYKVEAAQDARVSSVEARIGGWVISSPAFVVDPDLTVFNSRNTAIGATNSAGETNFPVYARARLANGRFGNATSVTTTSSFVDAKSTSTKVAENDYTSLLAVPTDLEVSSGVLQWNATTPSTALGPVYCAMAEFDLTTAQRVFPTALIQGYQIRPETLADMTFTLGSEEGRRWSIEGPMDDFGATRTNAHVSIEWRWTSGSALGSVDYVPFKPQEVYFRKAQFRLVWTRPTANYQVKLTRFTSKLYVPPAFDPSDVDGGTF